MYSQICSFYYNRYYTFTNIYYTTSLQWIITLIGFPIPVSAVLKASKDSSIIKLWVINGFKFTCPEAIKDNASW